VDPEAAPVIAKHHKIEPLDRAALFPGQILPADITKDEIYTLLGLHEGLGVTAFTSSTNPTRR
jgi:type I restriction enzyme M protein